MGERGPRGDHGQHGEQGERGEQGEQGEPGLSSRLTARTSFSFGIVVLIFAGLVAYGVLTYQVVNSRTQDNRDDIAELNEKTPAADRFLCERIEAATGATIDCDALPTAGLEPSG